MFTEELSIDEMLVVRGGNPPEDPEPTDPGSGEEDPG
jgi:hypothetical protein